MGVQQDHRSQMGRRRYAASWVRTDRIINSFLERGLGRERLLDGGDGLACGIDRSECHDFLQLPGKGEAVQERLTRRELETKIENEWARTRNYES